MNYLYDETFEGFLTCVYHHYYTEKAAGIYPQAGYQVDLTIPAVAVVTDSEKADLVCGAIREKISPWDLARVYRVFRTDTPAKEKNLLDYIRLGFRQGAGLRMLHTHPVVHAVENADRKLGNEVHRFCGILRFSAVCGRGCPEDADGGARLPAPQGQQILYSRIEPDHDIIEFLAPHFSDRFKWDPYIIHDRRRGKALVGYAGRWYVTDFTETGLLKEAEEEEEYRRLWRHYFQTTAIKERTNPRCQRSFMPVRYWKNITEMQQGNP